MTRVWAWLQRWWFLCWLTGVAVFVLGGVIWSLEAKAQADEAVRRLAAAQAPQHELARLRAELEARTAELHKIRNEDIAALQEAHDKQVAGLRNDVLACWERAVQIARHVVSEAP